MANTVCLDASLALLVLVVEDLTPKARSLWRAWNEAAFEIVTPPLFFAEVTSVLREQVHFRRLTAEEGEAAFQAFAGLDVVSLDTPDLQNRAWELSKRYNRPKAYDAQYLAVATARGCEMWTADRRLVNAVSEPWLKWVGDHEPAGER